MQGWGPFVEITKINEIRTGINIQDPYVLFQPFFVGCLSFCVGSKKEKKKKKLEEIECSKVPQNGCSSRDFIKLN